MPELKLDFRRTPHTSHAAACFILPAPLLGFKITFWILLLFTLGISGQAQSMSRLTGTISDPASEPVPGVLVMLGSPDRVFQTKSDANGQFLFESVPKGIYQLEVSTPGFVKQDLPIDLSAVPAQTLAIILSLGRSMPDMSYCGPHPSTTYESSKDFAHPPLAGIIHDSYSEAPVAKARASLWRAGDKRPILTAISDRTGRFEFNDVPAGRYVLRISRPGYWPEESKGLLLPRENSVSIAVPLLRRNRIVVCQ